MKAKVNDIHLKYELSGKDDAPVVVLSHSLASSMIMWNPQLKALENSFRVLRYDMRGHGKSDAPQGRYSIEMLADDVIALIDSLSIEAIHFVGLSIGGMIGQSLALTYPDRLRSVTLCDTISILPEEAKQSFQERITAAGKDGMSGQIDATMDRWFTPGFLKSNHPEVTMIRDQIAATPPAGYIGCSEAICQLNYLDRLPEITLPTLIMVGELDPGTPVAASIAIHERIANSQLVILPSAQHLSNIEQADAFNKALLEFLLQH
jgi:3-oxoadipate enol-lactonase